MSRSRHGLQTPTRFVRNPVRAQRSTLAATWRSSSTSAPCRMLSTALTTTAATRPCSSGYPVGVVAASLRVGDVLVGDSLFLSRTSAIVVSLRWWF